MMLTIPTKPSEATWTDAQWQAIFATGQDTLVAAAAGSGKTAVLIERLIQKIIADNDPLNVDELLVVTFTNASAAEMRSRLAEALEKAIAKDPHNRFLRKQLSLVNKAQISTLHSFCLTICRQYAYMIDLDPGFRIASQDEVALLQDDVLAKVLEEAYAAEGELAQQDVYELVDSFSSDRHDQDIEVLLLQLYNMSRVQPAPYAWLDSLAENYDVAEDATLDQLAFVTPLKKSIEHSLRTAESQLEKMLYYAQGGYGIDAYASIAQQELAFVKVALEKLTTSTWQDVYDYMQQAKWDRIPTIRKSDDVDMDIKELAKGYRDEAKDIVKAIKDTYFIRKPDYLVQEIRQMKPIIETLVKLVKHFTTAFQQAKQERAFVDFSDLEHYALEILTDQNEHGFSPSPVAKDFQKRFKEVLVDEYQDVNLLQETILQLVKSGDEADGNMFMVGDVKQSIYQFRLAEPRLFLRKYKEFTDGTATGGLKIDLNANFRSRSEVLQATNTVFSRIMDEAVGEIAYDEEAALKFSAKYDEKTSPVEFVVLNTEKSDTQDEEQEELAKAQQEARYIIRKIKEIVASEQPVFNSKDSSTRPIRYSDIVVLMRSMTWAHDFVEEFRAAGIPLYANATKGYFEALEVMMMLNVLKVVDNPYQDIELASVLRAPFFGLTENDLAQVRLAKQNVPYFEALLAYMESPENSALEKKITRFFTLLEEWRHMARRGTLAQLIWHIYLETNYYEYVGTMSNGKQRQANLRALHDRALAYEKTSFRGLFRFLRFVDRMKARGEDLGVAKSIGEAENVVRLMTIHSSKGLEFPVVFVAAMSKKFNEQDFKEPYLFDQDFGLAVKAVNPKERTMYTSLPYLAMKEKKIAKLKAEEMRVLYVAMTRAKERLILVASVKDWSKKEQGWQMLQQENEDILLPAHLRAKASSYLEWVAPVIVSHADYAHYTIVDEELEAQNNLHDKKTSLWQVKILQATQYSHMAEEEKITRAQDEQQSKADKDLVALINERFTAIYPHLQATSKKSKTSVSEIKRFEALQQEEDINYNVQSAKQQAIAKRPQFLQTQTLTRAEMGTVMHAVMQHVPQQGFATEEEVAPFIQQLVERQLLTEKESTIVDSEKVMRFFDSSIGQRFKRATTLLREIPFTMSRQDKEGDKQIVQGVIDCLFEENGEWILLDYKTDKIRPPFDNGPALLEEMKRRYDIQLTIYSEAISKINNITIVQKVLYLFDCDDFVTL